MPRTAARILRVVTSLVRWLAIALVAYGVIGTTVLSLGIVPKLANVDPEKLNLQHGFVWTIWPGTVHVKDLDLRFQDRKVQFQLEIDSAATHISILGLFQKRFHTTWLEAENVRYRMLHKLEDPAAHAERVAAFPQIFPGVPKILPKKKPSNPEDLWTIHLEDVTGTVSELWVLEYRYLGSGTVRGAFQLRPLRELWVGPAELRLDPGEIHSGEELFAAGFHGRLGVTVHQFNPEIPVGLEVLDHFSVRADLDGSLESLTPIDRYFTGAELEPGEPGRLAIHGGFEYGVITKGSTASVALDALTARVDDLSLRGDVRLALRAPLERDGVELLLGARDLTGTNDGKPAAHAPQAEVVLATPRRQLSDLGALRLHELELQSVKLPDLSRLSSLAPKDVKLRGGAAEIGLVLRGKGERANGGGAILLDRAALSMGERTFSATGTISTRISLSAKDGSGVLRDFKIDLQNLAARGPDRSGGGWWRIDAEPITFDQLPPKRLSGRVFARAQSGDALLALVPSLGALGDTFLSVLPMGRVVMELELQHAPQHTALDLVKARCGSITGNGRWRSDGENARGAFLVKMGPLSAGLSTDSEGFGVTPMATSDWLAEKYRALALRDRTSESRPEDTAKQPRAER